MRPTFRLAVLSVLSVVLAGQAMTAAAQSPKPGFDPANFDRSVKPCDDFYQFACGGWMAKNPVPADRPRYGRFDELREHNQAALHEILEKAAKPDPKRDAIDQKIGDYYASCMDEKAIEAKGTAPLQPLLAPIAALKSKEELPGLLAELHAAGVDALFSFGAQPDLRNSTVYIAGLGQDGLSLPDRDYYLGEEPRLADVRKQYPGHVQRMFELLGETPEAAAKSAQTVLDVETALARVSIDRVRRRDPRNRDNKMTRDQLAALAPNFDWNAYFKAAGTPAFTEVNVGWPDFFKGMNEQLAARSVEEWKTYLRWQALHRAAPLLPAAFVQENFAFFERTVTGSRELPPRWKRCVEWTDRQLGEALGQRYVEAHFGPESKERMGKLVDALEVALERDIRELPWMTEATKKRALEKLAAFGTKIGYPEKWRDYSSVRIVRGDA
ncbi:MAG TPA: M13 family metallopeptidase N-terminal domain-containing protein, partial [Thermoanaerobaculia bacterium]|nr:M13 family metallopeptidase N-terminal domain-containing protein [Thermoanaerobaculia bacterium]